MHQGGLRGGFSINIVAIGRLEWAMGVDVVVRNQDGTARSGTKEFLLMLAMVFSLCMTKCRWIPAVRRGISSS